MAQSHYPAVERDCLAIIWAIDKYQSYLEFSTFELLMDNAATKRLETAKHNNKKLLRWAMQLEPYNFTVIHISGAENEAVDVLSRNLLKGLKVKKEILEDKHNRTTGLENFQNTHQTVEAIMVNWIEEKTHIPLEEIIKWQQGDHEIQRIIEGYTLKIIVLIIEVKPKHI